MDVEAIIREIELQLQAAKAENDRKGVIAALNALGQWHRLREYKASHGRMPAPEQPDFDTSTLAEIEKAEKARQDDDNKLN